MRKSLLACLSGVAVVAFASRAESASWWYIGKSQGGDVSVADAASISTVGDIRLLWVWSFDKTPKRGVYETRQRMTINCKHQTIISSNYVEYALDGSVLKSETAPSYESPTPIIPDTMGEAYRDFACAEEDQWEKLGFFGPLVDPAKAFSSHPASPSRRPARKPAYRPTKVKQI